MTLVVLWVWSVCVGRGSGSDWDQQRPEPVYVSVTQAVFKVQVPLIMCRRRCRGSSGFSFQSSVEKSLRVRQVLCKDMWRVSCDCHSEKPQSWPPLLHQVFLLLRLLMTHVTSGTINGLHTHIYRCNLHIFPGRLTDTDSSQPLNTWRDVDLG